MILLKDNNRFTEYKFKKEADFEAEIISSKLAIFGKDTIFIDAKKKVDSQALGSAIPDGFLFDMSDTDNHEFYLVEVELESHDFYNHIFPQITKFFAFYRNKEKQKKLVEKLFSIITSDGELTKQFKKYLNNQEIYKHLNDLIDSSQNILLIIDGEKPELPEITDTYSDTWGKMVRLMTIKKFIYKDENLLMVHPEFENIEFSFEETPDEVEKKSNIYTEDYHLEGVNEDVKKIYHHLKGKLREINDSYIFNPQKYYISIRGKKNIVYLKLRKKKIRMIVMMSENDIRKRIKKNSIKTFSAAVQNFYNGPCVAVDIHDTENINEIDELIKVLIRGETSD